MHIHTHGVNILTIALLYIFSIMSIMAGTILTLNYNKDKRYYKETTAEIVDIIEYGDSSYEVYVSYEADGEYYDYIRNNSYNIGMDIGDHITITYDTRNPGNVVTGKKETTIISYILFGFGAMFGSIGTVLLIIKTKHKNY